MLERHGDAMADDGRTSLFDGMLDDARHTLVWNWIGNGLIELEFLPLYVLTVEQP